MGKKGKHKNAAAHSSSTKNTRKQVLKACRYQQGLEYALKMWAQITCYKIGLTKFILPHYGVFECSQGRRIKEGEKNHVSGKLVC